MRKRRKRQADLSSSGEEDEVVLHGDSNGFVLLVTLDLHQPSLKGVQQSAGLQKNKNKEDRDSVEVLEKKRLKNKKKQKMKRSGEWEYLCGGEKIQMKKRKNRRNHIVEI